MKRSGKTHIVVILGILGIIVTIALVFFSGESPQTKASKFMTALATANADELAQYSYDETRTEEELKVAWEQSLKDSKYYRFAWKPDAAVLTNDTLATVKLIVVRNPGAQSYDENFEIELRKFDGEWKVVVPSISRELYPWLPRPKEQA